MKHPGRLSGGQFDAFMARFFPSFAGGFLLCALASGSGIALWQHSYLRGVPDSGNYTMAVLLGLVLLLCTGQFAFIRGLRWGIWLVVPCLLAPALVAASLFGTRYAGPGQLAVLALALLGLLVINSKRHRGMRQRLHEMRLQRKGVLPATPADHFPDGAPPSKPWLARVVLGLLVIMVACKIYLVFWG
ncbi:hypothetical protein [Pseudomonas sp. S36]|uniref:hypothetical protein n=1 Tax=Pseudomonas sp. S36 TaxID=2767447 RepID=UPI001914698B|nr:hypothetical protein [Pseudomonas sp. S36]MBK4988225.1 hypothetical protein [Pseudomonas sp. S36]